MVSPSITYPLPPLWGECLRCTLMYKWMVSFGRDTENEAVVSPNPGKNAYCKERWRSLCFSESSSLLPAQSLCTCCSLCFSPRAPESSVVFIFLVGTLVPPPQRCCPWPLCLKWFLLLFVMLSYFIFFVTFITTPQIIVLYVSFTTCYWPSPCISF